MHSQLRQPFIYTVAGDDVPDKQPIIDTILQAVSLLTDPHSGGGTSPTYFYMTPFNPSKHNLQLEFIRHDQAPVHVQVGALGFPYDGRVSAMGHVIPARCCHILGAKPRPNITFSFSHNYGERSPFLVLSSC